MDQGRLGIFQASGAVSSQSEVRILVNGAGNQAGNFGCLCLILTEDVGKRAGKGSRALNTGKVNFTNVGAVLDC